MIFRRAIELAIPLLALAYLTGDVVAAGQFVAMLTLILLPLAGIWTALLRRVETIVPGLRACLACALAILAVTPLYYLRRAIPLPGYIADVLVVIVLIVISVGSGGLRQLLRFLASPPLHLARTMVFIVVPLIAILLWTGFEVKTGVSVSYYGLFTVDYSNLANVAALVKISPGLPLPATAGDAFAGYHWYFFAQPAWMSELFGRDSRVALLLGMCNLLSAALLVATLFVVVRGFAKAVSDRAITLAVALALLAPFTTYAYLVAIKVLHQPWFSTGSRNSLLLSPINSMTSFGNNTTALVLALLVCRLVAIWNESPRWPVAVLIAALATAVFGYSATLFLPLALALGVWTLFEQVRSPLRLLIIGVPVFGLVVAALRSTGVLGSSGERPALSFDRGQFIQNVLFGMAPVMLLTAISLWRRPGQAERRFSIYLTLMLACIAVPTLITLAGSRTGDAALSMKTASLLAVACARVVAGGIQYLLDRWRDGRRGLTIIAAIVVAAGLANTAAYSLQFVVSRALGRGAQPSRISRDYYETLQHIRLHTPRSAVVIDPFSSVFTDTITTLAIAERRVWLPNDYSMQFFGADTATSMQRRRDEFNAWRESGYADGPVGSRFSAAADVLITDSGSPAAPWKLLAKRPGYSVYSSQFRSAGSPAR